MTEQAKPVDPIAHLTALAEELFSVEADVARLNEELKTAQRRAQSLTEHEIPEAMDTAGVQDITTMSGLVIEVKDEVKAGDLKKPTGLDWLRTIGEAGCIKTAVTVPFATGSENDADEFVERLSGEGILATKAAVVNHMTLKSIIRKKLEDGVDVPMADLGAFQFRKASVKAKKQ